MGKARDLFKKIRDISEKIHARIGTIKDINCKDLTKQKRLKSGGKNTQKNYSRKVFMTQITIMVWSHTYSCTSWSVKWALGSITTNKASGGDRIPAELFNILKDDVLSMPANLENSAGLEEVSFHFNPKEGQCQRMFKVCTIVFISHDSKVMLKVLHARFQQYMN